MTEGVVGLIGLMLAANILKLGVAPLRTLVSGEIVLRARGFLVDVVLVLVVVEVVVVVVVVVVVDAVVLLVVVVTALSPFSVALDDCWDLKTSSGLGRGLLVEITLGSARCLVSVLV